MYALTPLFWYRPIFMTELLAAEAIFCGKLNKRKKFGWRFLLAAVCCYSAAFAFPIPYYNAAYCSFMFICLFGVTLAVMPLLFDEPFSNALFCCLAAYIVQHVAYELNDLSVVVFGLNGGAPLDSYGSASIDGNYPFIRISSEYYVFGIFLFLFAKSALYCLIYTAVYVLAWRFFASRIEKYDLLHLKTVSVIVLLAVIIAVAIVFSSVNTYLIEAVDKPRITNIMLYLHNILCCALALYIQFELPRRRKLKSELDTVNGLREREREQYSISKENIELINLKCHDMRHRLKNATGGELSREVEDIISVYDSAVKTGNTSLDVILTEKSLICNKNGIRLDCIADGKSLAFIDESDLYSLFGNMLENAIDAVSKCPIDGRVINLSVRKINNFLSVCVSNPYAETLKRSGDGFLSTKGNSDFHGYGLKSIRLISEKYGGEMFVKTDRGIFDLTIALPLPLE